MQTSTPAVPRVIAEGLARDRSKWTAMISSEVQRTLVKSPPELWAEISDADALARHLGEFGEIRITRVHREHKVEWEGSDASGTVVIQPSGWGTKVKLTVTRELQRDPVDAHEGRDERPDERPHEHPDEGPNEDPNEDASERASHAPRAASASETRPSDPRALAPVARPAGVESDADDQRESSPADPAPAAEPCLDEEPALEREAEPGVGHEPTGESPDHVPASAPQRRLGFFARLFGRGRDAPATSEPEPPVGAHASERAAQERDGAVAVRTAPSAPEEPLGAAPVAAASAGAASPADLSPLSPEEPEPAAVGNGEGELRAEEAAAQPAERPPGGVEQPAGEDGQPLAEPADTEPTDISAEIRAAEETAAEQVTAVLTGVLDRLGAAHHRPFSRS
jgi:hypothetical protein